MAGKQYVWMDGKFVDSGKATVNVLTHSLQYGSGIFEGVRCYSTNKGSAIFRLGDHVERLFNTAKIHSMPLPYSKEEIVSAVVGTVRKNGIKDGYIRPFAFYNDTHIGLSTSGKKVGVAIAAIPFGNYFSNKDKGIRCKISSWHRINSQILPPMAKASGNYLNSIIASTEAKSSGADEAIMLSSSGYVAEGTGENIFLVKSSRLITPSDSSDILKGITRDSIIKIAEAMGIGVEEREVHREELFTSDELFFVGTAAEVTPILTVDNIRIGSGGIGPMTKSLAERYSGAVHGEEEAYVSWLTYV
jgi:branched-chain amino acid aminotransferase